jgi:putative transposase
MARPLRIQFPGAFYHVTCRGNAKKAIFLDDSDRLRFEKLLSESLEMYQVLLYVYTLMDNHFHLVVQTKHANLSEFMRRFNISYTSWFNYHHNRCGHLYQGRYHAFLIDADSYLLEVSRYGHLNPIHVKIIEELGYEAQWQYIQRYRWSSLPGYLNERSRVKFVQYDMILEMAGGCEVYEKFILDGLKNATENPFNKVQHGLILGDADFADRIKNKHVAKGSLREQPTYRQIGANPVEPALLIACVIKVLDTGIEGIRSRSRHGIDRGIVAELLYRHSNITQEKIGIFLGGIDYTAVSRLRSRLRLLMERESEVRSKFEKAEQSLAKLSNVKI